MNDFESSSPPSPADAPAAGRAPQVNGVAVPEALLVPEAWLPSLFVRVDMSEIAWFADVPVERALEVCREATGVEPRRRRVLDRYFDTPGRALFGRGVSVRLREYLEPPREIAYEVIAAGWGGERSGGRRVRGLVQTFERNGAADVPRLLERYARAGFEEVARFDKARWTFEVVPSRSADSYGKVLHSPERDGVEGARGMLRVLDFGIKADIDDIRDSPFAEPSIVEVEYDAARQAQAAPLIERIRAGLGPAPREKLYGKIAYLLGGPEAAPG